MCLQGYYQEAGRAGRDGLPSDCILYYAARDIPRIHQMLRRGSKGRTKQARFQKGMELLDQVISCKGALQVTHTFALWPDTIKEVVLCQHSKMPMQDACHTSISQLTLLPAAGQ